MAKGSKAKKLLKIAGGKAGKITVETLAQAHAARDSFATKLLEENAGYLAVWLGSIIDLLEPHIIVFGGGMGKLMHSFSPLLRKQISKWSVNPRANEISILPAAYGEDAGIAGAAAILL